MVDRVAFTAVFIDKKTEGKKREHVCTRNQIVYWWMQKSLQHPKVFPRGPPPRYLPGPLRLNFRVQMGSGVFRKVWP